MPALGRDGDRHIRTVHHLATADVVSVTVVAPTAMMADGLSTAVMILRRKRGPRALEQRGVAGLLLGPDGTAHTKHGFGARG